MKELLFLQALLGNINRLEATLGNEWSYYKEQLLSIQSKIIDGTTKLELDDCINELLDLLLSSNVADLVRQLYDEASNKQNDTLNRRSLNVNGVHNPADVLFKIKSTGASLASNILEDNSNDGIPVPIFYATDRARENNKYGSKRGILEYGVASVSIPYDHRMGILERPQWWKFQFKETSNDHVMLVNYEQLEQGMFITSFKHALSSSGHDSVLIFIHGYNVTFEDAMRRAGQLVYDLNYNGLALVYSWPSAGSFLKYTVDEANIEWTIPNLKDVFKLLKFEIGVNTINVIAHSMGNRALINAIRLLYHQPLEINPPSVFEQIILAAPDVDRDTFRSVISELSGKAKRFTLYASSRDRALHLSKRIHGYPRAGDSGSNILVVKDTIDTIDATEVDTSLIGHSYYGDNRSILTDLFSIFNQGSSLPRFGMTRMELLGLPYWAFRP